ncbi:hypothetical protein K2Q02_01420 [Patescibacteria group bacterium]|nr:hypothetical protein [Patescibacteria group bacterium]
MENSLTTIIDDNGITCKVVTVEESPLPYVKKFIKDIFWTYTLRHLYMTYLTVRYYNGDIDKAFKENPE